MKVIDLLNVIRNSDRVRILHRENQDAKGNVLLSRYRIEIPETFNEREILEFRANPELNMKDWEKRGLLGPQDPQAVPIYKFEDFEMRLYYDIYI